LVLDERGTVSSKHFTSFLRRCGILSDDPRMKTAFLRLAENGAIDNDVQLDMPTFTHIVSDCELLIHRCVQRQLRIPDFESFTEIIKEVYEEVLPDVSGENAQYIPQLAEVDPDQFAISVTSVDGQHFSIGDFDKQFCIQSCSKPISYLLALDQFGIEYVHKSVSTEPSGRAFNEMCLKDTDDPERKIPHNPCINAGAIMAVSMVYPEYTRAIRLEKVLALWKRLSGGNDAPIGYDDATYRSESATASGNWCLGYMMKKYNAFPPCFSDLGETLELYFQICSILSTSKAMSIMSATLANGGLNPLTGERVFDVEQVRNALPIMLMAGMYDYSGQWAFDIGVPAKSGVGGCVYAVIPNVCGISIWSPRLDPVGNSARGVAVCKALVKRLQFHNFEVFSGIARTKVDLTMPRYVSMVKQMSDVLFAASEGDVGGLSSMNQSGVDLFVADYDGRTALHLAAAEGHAPVVKYLLTLLPSGEAGTAIVSKTDRWGGSPLDDATENENHDCIELLKERGAQQLLSMDVGKSPRRSQSRLSDSATDKLGIEDSAPILLHAAAAGDLDTLIYYAASGENLNQRDYDLRTALHLASSNGHLTAIRYLCHQLGSQCAKVTDRWGNSPLDDAKREGHDECLELLQRYA